MVDPDNYPIDARLEERFLSHSATLAQLDKEYEDDDEGNYPEYPERVAITMTGGNVSNEMLWKRKDDKDYADDFYVAMATFKEQIMLSLGTDLRNNLRRPSVGSITMDGQDIFHWVCDKIGKLTPSDLQEMQLELRVPFTTPKNFEKELGRFDLAAATLHDSGAPLSDIDLYLVLLTKAQHLPPLLAILHTYADDKEVHLQDCLHSITEKYTRRSATSTAMEDTRATVAAVSEKEPTGRERADETERKRNRNEANKTDRVRKEKFCWLHTHKGRQTSHVSKDCKNMAAQPLRYSKEMRNATSYEECVAKHRKHTV
jgi:hypothetical protein